MYKIEKNVPLPLNYRNPKFPLAKMDIGDSFFVPEKDISSRNALSGIVSMKGMALQRKFTVHKEYNGYRVWRVK